MAEYFRHWLKMGKLMTRVPKIFHVNWFRTDAEGNFLWPGYGENLRILEWILNRCRNNVDAKRTAIGYIPNVGDIDMTGLKISKDAMKKLFEIRKEEWQSEVEDQKKFLATFGKSLPKEIMQEHKALENRIKKELR
jgi:phosphoenolpyruvate carboxykinase (GTP)